MKKLTVLFLSLLLAAVTVTSTLTAVLSVRTVDNESFDSPRYRLDPLADGKTYDTTEPHAILDYTSKDAQSLMYTISFHQRLSEGSHTTLEASWHDPQGDITLPEGTRAADIRYTVIAYRTEKSCKGEMFASRSDIPTMGQSGTHVNWNWNASGEWETAVIENAAWSGASEDVTILKLRFDPLEGGVAAGDTIDICFIAFFPTKEEAEGFNFEAYKAKHAPVTEAPTEAPTEPETDPDYTWPNPDYSEQETSWIDNNPGTLTYTPSEDGQTVTISYQLNGKTVSYTVPANHNHLFGGYAATDDLGRSLLDSNEVGAYDESRRQIGLFYFLWHGEEHDRGLYDLQKILDELGREGAANMSNGRYGGLGVMHWFAEPLYGYYYINDEWVLRKHVELLTAAGVDFLYFDVTNAETFIPQALKLMAVLHEFNEQGYDAPKVVFYTNTDYGNVIAELHKEIYRKEMYPDTWYMMGNRPVIIAPGNPGNPRYTYMTTQWPNAEEFNANAWPWMDFEWPQRIYETDKGAPHAVSVSIAQHSGTVCFSDSSLKGNYTNRGRSFVNPDNIPSTDKEAFDKVLKAAYEAWEADPSRSNLGLNFQAQWDYALQSDAPTILVTGWNEWIAGNWGCFVDAASVEFSRDAEMMRGGYFDNYYMQMAINIQKAKGASPIILQDMRKAINVTGGFDQWADIPVTYTDAQGDTMVRDHEGFGDMHYTNHTGRNDIVAAKTVTDSKNVYFYVRTAEEITKYNDTSSWMQIYLNTDRETTGWYGYDFIINYKAEGDFTTTVAKYSGKDGAYGFTECGKVSYRVSGNEMMVAVPLEMLGIEGYLEIDLEFKVADSRSVYDEMEDFYCDGDAAPLGRMNYVFQNYVKGVSEIVYPDPNTPPVTETEAPSEEITDAPETPTEADTDAPAVESETQPGKKGCGSAVIAVAPLLAMVCGLALVRKKKED